MKITCEKCGATIVVNGFGRPRLKISVKKVYDALRRCKNVRAAASQLGCSGGYIYQRLKEDGRTAKEVIRSSKKVMVGQ